MIQTVWKMRPNVQNTSVTPFILLAGFMLAVVVAVVVVVVKLLDSNINHIFIFHVQLDWRFTSFQLFSIETELES